MRKMLIPLCLLLTFNAFAEPMSYADRSSQVDGLTNYQVSPLSQYLSKEQYNEIIVEGSWKEQRAQAEKTLRRQATVLTVDTRNHEACEKIKLKLEKQNPFNDYSELCIEDEQHPYNSIISLDGQSQETRLYFDEMKSVVPDRYKKLSKETRNIAALGVMTIGLIYMLPEDVSNWDRSEMSNLGKNWKENVKEGPVKDKDDWYINYIGHPLSGAAYHIVARNAGLGPWESFGYSVFMSTVFWEYGIEAFAEVPSIQDLILTPIVGSALGELFHRSIQKIDQNGGKLMGSKRLGNFAKNVMNPSEPLRRWVNDKVFEQEFIKDSRTFLFTRSPSRDPLHMNQGIQSYESESYIGVGIEFKFNL